MPKLYEAGQSPDSLHARLNQHRSGLPQVNISGQGKCLPTGEAIAPTLPPMTTGDRIRKARLGAGYRTQAAFARTIGVSRSLVHQWESSVKKPGRDNLAQMAGLTGVPIEYLLGRADQMRRSLTVEDPLLIRIHLNLLRMDRPMQQAFAELLEKTINFAGVPQKGELER